MRKGMPCLCIVPSFSRKFYGEKRAKIIAILHPKKAEMRSSKGFQYIAKSGFYIVVIFISFGVKLVSD